MKEFFESKAELINAWKERVEINRDIINNSTYFESFVEAYVKLFEDISFFSSKYDQFLTEAKDILYSMCIRKSYLTSPTIISSVEIGKKTFRIDNDKLSSIVSKKREDFLDSLDLHEELEIIDNEEDYIYYSQELYEIAKIIITKQGHGLTLEDLHSIIKSEEVYKKLPYEIANEVLFQLADVRFPSPIVKVEIEEEEDQDEEISDIKTRDEEIYVNGKKINEIKLPLEFYPGLDSAYRLFSDICNDLERNFEKIKALGIKYKTQLLQQRTDVLGDLDKKLNSSPPLESHDFLSEIELFTKLATIYNSLDGWNLRKHLAGTLKKHKLKKNTSDENNIFMFIDKEIRIPWNISESFTIRTEETRDLVAKQNGMFKDYFRKILRIRELDEYSQILLKQLEKMDPEFQVNLSRLAELVKMKKEITEETLLYLLRKYPKIGKYDEMSQMLRFAKPEDVTNLIDKLLKLYDEPSEKNI